MKYQIIKSVLEYSINDDENNIPHEIIENNNLFTLLEVDNESQANYICQRLNTIQSLHNNDFIIENQRPNEMYYYYYQ